MAATKQVVETIGHDVKDTPTATVVRKPTSKAAGTRMGIFQDWREGSTTGKGRRHCHTLRDGR